MNEQNMYNGYYTEWMKETMCIMQNEWKWQWGIIQNECIDDNEYYRMNEWDNVYYDMKQHAVIRWVHTWMSERDNGYDTEWMKETMGIIQNEWKRQWVLYRMNERGNGYYREWMNEPMSIIQHEWKRQWVLYRMNEGDNGYYAELMKETMGIMQNEWKWQWVLCRMNERDNGYV